MLDLPSCTKENFLFSGIKHNADDSIGFSNLTQLLGILGWASSFYPSQFCVVLLNDRQKKQTFQEIQTKTHCSLHCHNLSVWSWWGCFSLWYCLSFPSWNNKVGSIYSSSNNSTKWYSWTRNVLQKLIFNISKKRFCNAVHALKRFLVLSLVPAFSDRV